MELDEIGDAKQRCFGIKSQRTTHKLQTDVWFASQQRRTETQLIGNFTVPQQFCQQYVEPILFKMDWLDNALV
jgi:hypothetical protein